jgi:hypothetical protein
MKCDSQASFLARTFVSPCFGRELKAKVATGMVENYYEMINNSSKFPKAMLLVPNKHTTINLMVTRMLTKWDGFSFEHCFFVGYNIQGMGSCLS